MTPTDLPDAEARRRASTDFESNLVVQAGAGTGKTSLLVERILNAVGSNRLRVRELAAITFTEKAAGEMRERLALGLDRLRALARGTASPAGDDEGDRAFRWLRAEAGVSADAIVRRALEAMEELDSATVTTIHGFCSEVLHAFPAEAGVDPSFVVDSGELASSLVDEQWESFVARELGPNAARGELWSALLSKMPLAQIGEVAEGLAGFLIPGELRLPDNAFPDPLELLRGEAAAVRERVDWLLRPEHGLSGVGQGFFLRSRDAIDALLEDGLPGLSRYLDGDGQLVKRLQSNPPSPTKSLRVSDEEFKAVRHAVTHLLKPLLKVDDQTLALALEAATPFVEEYREAYLRRGLVSFDGLLALCRDLLRDQPDVRERTKERFRMVLVDEFQDTDPLQHEIVLLLAERPDGAAREAYLAELDPGRLFVVGDAKQSIYRFRGADYGAYRLAIRRIVETGGEILHLVGNFRSVPGLIEPANRVFEAAEGCWQPSDYQPEYVPIEAVRDQPDDDPRVELWTVEIDGATKADERRRIEGQLLAEAIHAWVEKEHRCSYHQITMLFRAFAPITHYLRALRQREIPFVVDGGKDFLRRPEVGQLMATFRTLSQPSDPPALLAYLRSAAASVPDTELAAYAEAGGGWDWRSDVDPERYPRIATGFERLRQISDEIRHLPADAAVRVVLERTLLLPLGAIAFEGPQRVANLRKLTAAAAELARDGRLSLEQVVEGLEEGELEDIKTDRPLSDDAAEAIRITSIHRMKGLENDWIILPDLARERMGWSYERPTAIKSVQRPDGRAALAMRVGGMSNATDVWYGIEHERHEAAEETRVLYVALTRARERMVVLVAPKERAPGVRALAPWGYDPGAPPPDGALIADGHVLHRVPRVRPPLRAVSRPVSESARQAVERYELAVQTLREAATPPLASPSGLHEETQDARDAGRPPFATQSRDLAKGVGVVVHRLLEGWRGGDVESLQSRLPRVCKEAAEQLNLPLRALRKEVTTVIEGFSASQLVPWLERIEQLGTEVPVLVRREDGRAFRGSIDLLYRDPEGQLVVADYKTDREVDPERLREKYANQLEVYAEAVTKAWGLDTPVRTELWVLRTGERVAVN